MCPNMMLFHSAVYNTKTSFHQSSWPEEIKQGTRALPVSTISSTCKIQGFPLCRISDFWSVVQAFDFLGCHRAKVGSQFPMKMELINCPGTSVTSYKPISHNIPKEQSPQFSLTEIKCVTPLSLLMNTARIPSINGAVWQEFFLVSICASFQNNVLTTA